MSIHVVALSLVLDAALGAWLGVMAFFSFVGAPRAFAVFDDRGGEYVNDVFPRYYRLGVVLGTVAIVAGLALGFVGSYGPVLIVLLGSTAVATLLAGYSVASLIPKMEAAGEDGFSRYHRQSVVLNGLAMLAVAVALVASHLP
jgi:hypothetical protein